MSKTSVCKNLQHFHFCSKNFSRIASKVFNCVPWLFVSTISTNYEDNDGKVVRTSLYATAGKIAVVWRHSLYREMTSESVNVAAYMRAVWRDRCSIAANRSCFILKYERKPTLVYKKKYSTGGYFLNYKWTFCWCHKMIHKVKEKKNLH